MIGRDGRRELDGALTRLYGLIESSMGEVDRAHHGMGIGELIVSSQYLTHQGLGFGGGGGAVGNEPVARTNHEHPTEHDLGHELFWIESN